MSIAIIGGGASAMILAAKLKNKEATIIERNNKLGKKLLLTGNGKCNFTNLNFENLHEKYNNSFAIEIYKNYNNNSFIDFFNEIGIVPKIETHKGIDYVYPNSNKSLSVYYCLLDRITFNGVNILYNSFVKEVKKINDKFIVILDSDEKFTFDKIVLATGGMSYKNTGSDGNGYEIAKSFGHSIVHPMPGLTALKYNFALDNNKKFSGKCRVNAKVKCHSCKYSFEEFGEIQFSEDTISGIPILNLSNKICRNFNNDDCVKINIDFSHSLFENIKQNRIEKDDIISFLLYRKKNTWYRDVKDFLSGYLPDEISELILSFSGIKNIRVSNLTERDIDRLAKNLVEFEIIIDKIPSFDNAQITLGGVNVNEININTLESKLVKGLYFSGEVIDIDGICGGYNLQLAYSTASIISKCI